MSNKDNVHREYTQQKEPNGSTTAIENVYYDWPATKYFQWQFQGKWTEEEKARVEEVLFEHVPFYNFDNHYVFYKWVWGNKFPFVALRRYQDDGLHAYGVTIEDFVESLLKRLTERDHL